MLIVAALYKFTRFEDPDALRAPLASGVRRPWGEGIAPARAGGDQRHHRGDHAPGSMRCWTHIRGLPGCADLDWKESTAAQMPFGRIKVRLKREIVTMGVPGTDPNALVGTYVAPGDWNDLIAAPDVAVIDTRNDYETAIGTFAGAVDPGTESFPRFPGLVGGQPRPVPQQADRHVLHRRDPVREIDGLPEGAGGRGSLSPARAAF
jgi:UPF0176 protein